MIYSSWHIEQDRLILVILGHFLPFYSPKNPKIQNFEKNDKIAKYIIILLMRTKNHNHMMHGSWAMEWDRQNFLSFWAIFCPITHLTIPRISIFKKWKTPQKNNNSNTWRFIILHMCTINDNHTVYNFWDKERNWQNFLLFCTIFCPFTKLTTQKFKILKKWNANIWKYKHFTNVHHK